MKRALCGEPAGASGGAEDGDGAARGREQLTPSAYFLHRLCKSGCSPKPSLIECLCTLDAAHALAAEAESSPPPSSSTTASGSTSSDDPAYYDTESVQYVVAADVRGLERILTSARMANMQNRCGETLMMKCCRHLSDRRGVAVLQTLLQRGANAMVCCDVGKNCLHDLFWMNVPPPVESMRAMEARPSPLVPLGTLLYGEKGY